MELKLSTIKKKKFYFKKTKCIKKSLSAYGNLDNSLNTYIKQRPKTLELLRTKSNRLHIYSQRK